jgi:16S rRNA A1518/A1519 N6-dimethyltransferase RsmA/KsgA/DIM1 with predicted DNA glycosylase/AP lyase activity
MPILIFSVIFIITLIFFFSSQTLSPIPYFPSQSVDLPKIIKALNLKNGQIIFDLGAGDGIVIFNAAKSSFQKKLNTKFIAVEINPVLILILHLRCFFHPNKKNIKIIYGDIFTMNFKKLLTFNFSLLTFYLYISPWFLEKVIENCKMKNEKFSVVSYMYPIKSLKKKEKIIQGKNKIFVYNVVNG